MGRASGEGSEGRRSASGEIDSRRHGGDRSGPMRRDFVQSAPSPGLPPGLIPAPSPAPILPSMPSSVPELAAAVLQAVLTAGLAALSLYLYRRYRKPYFAWFSAAWGLYVLRIAAIV